jgi:transposase-like protein
MARHLGYQKYDPAGHHSGKSRNGQRVKTIKGDFAEVLNAVPRDRNGTLEPQIIPKHDTSRSAVTPTGMISLADMPFSPAHYYGR